MQWAVPGAIDDRMLAVNTISLRRLFLTAAVAILLGLTGCESLDGNEAPTKPYTQQEVIELWASAMSRADGETACDLAVPKLQERFIYEANARKLTDSELCSESFKAIYEDRKELGMTLQVREISLIEQKENSAYYEVAWRESEDGDGMGVALIKTSDGWLVKE